MAAEKGVASSPPAEPQLYCLSCFNKITLDASWSEEAQLESLFKFLESSSPMVPRNAPASSSSSQTTNPAVFPPFNSENLHKLSPFFERASILSEVDQPLCVECCVTHLERITANLQKDTEELEGYQTFIQDLEYNKDYDENELDEQLLALEEAVNAQREELRQIGDQKESTKNELALIRAEETKLDIIDERLCELTNKHDEDVQSFVEEKNHLDRIMIVTTNRLKMVTSTHTFNEAFFIWFDGHFGTINGLRLGTLGNVQVKWPEINAALGLCTLLLDSVAKYVNFKFHTYYLQPAGSLSKIGFVDDLRTTFDLYHSGLSLGNLFSGKSFDNGLVAMLNCLAQLCDRANELDQGLRQRFFRIHGDKINNISIRRSASTDEEWTRALKLMLSNMKFLLAWSEILSRSKS